MDLNLAMLALGLIGKCAPTSELLDQYNVSEMDDCQEEMAYIVSLLKQRGGGKKHKQQNKPRL